MKKFLSILCLATMLLGLAACKKKNDPLPYEDFSYSTGINDRGFFEGITATDYVTLPTYNGISVPAEVLTADEEKVTEQVQKILENYPNYTQVTDRAVKDGDTVFIDYVGYIDNVAFENGSTEGKGTTVTIGVTNYIEGFLPQLIGHTPGEEFDIHVTFPENYHVEDKRGKDAVFHIVLHYIQEEEVLPELTDEIAEKFEFATADELLADIKAWQIGQQKSAFLTELLDQTTLKKEVPQVVLDHIIGSDLAYYYAYASSQNISPLELLQSYFNYKSVQEFIDANMEEYKALATEYLAVQAIAEQENLEVSDADLETTGLLSSKADYGLPYLKMYYLHNTAIVNFVFDHAAK